MFCARYGWPRSKCFRDYQPEQALLLPPSLEDWLPEGHLARFIRDVVAALDLRPIDQSYEKDGRGQAAYQPLMMLKVLFYGYCIGIAASRKIEKAPCENVAFRYLSANQHPDHDTLAEFRRRPWTAVAALFVEVLKLCQKAGLGKLGHVALEGTKIKAHASRYRNCSYERLSEQEKKRATPEGRAVYAKRREIVEPVFGQIKPWRSFRQFLLRGPAKTRAEGRLIGLTHNLLKLYRAGWTPQPI